MYYKSLEILYEQYDVGHQNAKEELLNGTKKMNDWIVSISPKERLDINPLNFINANNIRPDVAMRIFEDATNQGMFTENYRYRDEFSGEVIASSKDFKSLENMLVELSENEGLTFIPDLIEKSYKLEENINENYVPLQKNGYGGGKSKQINFTRENAKILGIGDESF